MASEGESGRESGRVGSRKEQFAVEAVRREPGENLNV